MQQVQSFNKCLKDIAVTSPRVVGARTRPWAPPTPWPSLASGARAWPPRTWLLLGGAAAWLLFLGYVLIPRLALAAAAWNSLVVVHRWGCRPLHGILVLRRFRAAGISLPVILLWVVFVTSSASHPILLPVLSMLVIIQVIIPWGSPAWGAGARAWPGVAAIVASITVLCITLHPIFFLWIWWHLWKGWALYYKVLSIDLPDLHAFCINYLNSHEANWEV